MVRLSWSYDPSPPGFHATAVASSVDAVFRVRHTDVEVQVPGAYPMEMAVTQPLNGLFGGQVNRGPVPPPAEGEPAAAPAAPPAEEFKKSRRSTAIVLAHGLLVSDYKGKFLSEVARLLAREGYTVVRFATKLTEKKRVTNFQMAVEAAAASPYCRFVERWVFGGVSVGARVAAAALSQLQSGAWRPQVNINVAGAAFVAYPFHDANEAGQALATLAGTGGVAAVSATRGRQAHDSGHEALCKLSTALLFCVGTSDERCEAEVLRAAAGKLETKGRVRYAMLPGCNHSLKRKGGKHVDATALRTCAGAMLDWVRLLEADNAGDASPESEHLIAGIPDETAWAAMEEAAALASPEPGSALKKRKAEAAAPGDDVAPPPILAAPIMPAPGLPVASTPPPVANNFAPPPYNLG